MIRFAIGNSVVALAMCVWCVLGGVSMPMWNGLEPIAFDLTGPMRETAIMALMMLGPTVVGGVLMGAAGVHAVSPRRVFHPHVRHGLGLWQIARGMLAAALTYCAASVAMVFTPDSELIQTLVMAGIGTAVGGALTLAAARWRPGTCRGCGYDLSAMTVSGGGRCPECGVQVLENY